MGKFSYFICDRCGKTEEYNPLWIIPNVRIYKNPKMKLVFSRFPDTEARYGFAYEKEIELCEECMTSCSEWLKAGKKKNGGAEDA